MNANKNERQGTAVQAAMARTLKRLYSLSVALMRSEAAYEKYFEEATLLFSEEKTDNELVDGLLDHLRRLENNTFLRTSSLLTMYMALLYVVVEGWRKWGFVNAEVDTLLESSYVQDLKEYRHAIFHASDFDHRDILQWTADAERVRWTRSLSDALHDALKDWHANVEARVTQHLLRVGY
jgi:hypothetical protein